MFLSDVADYNPSPEEMQPATMGMQPMTVQPVFTPVAAQTSTSAATVRLPRYFELQLGERERAPH